MSCTGARAVDERPSSRTAYGAPEAPVIAMTIGALRHAADQRDSETCAMP